MLHKIIDIQQLNDDDRTHIFLTLDALLRDAKARKTYALTRPEKAIRVIKE